MLDALTARLNSRFGIGIERTILYHLTSAEPVPRLRFAPGVSLDSLSPNSVSILGEGDATDPALIEERLRSGDVCYLAYLHGRLAHHSWVKCSGIQQVSEAGRSYPVAPGEFWIYHCWTAPWARGRCIYPCVLTAMVNEHFRWGFTTARIYTTAGNGASQRAIARAGFRMGPVLRSLRLGRRHFPLD